MRTEVWVQLGNLAVMLWIAFSVRHLNISTGWSKPRYEAHTGLIAQGEAVVFLLQRTVWKLDPSQGIHLPPRSEALPDLGDELRDLATSRTRVRLLAGKGSQDAADELAQEVAYFLPIRRMPSQTWTNRQVAEPELARMRSKLNTYVEVVRDELGLGYTIHRGIRRFVRRGAERPALNAHQSGS